MVQTILPTGRLERDVVVRGAATAGGCGLEVGGVRGDVGLRREALTAATAVAATLESALAATTEELDRVGDDVDRLALVALLVLPLAPLETAVDRDRPALL